MGGMGCAIFFGFCIRWNLNFNEDPPHVLGWQELLFTATSLPRRNGFPETETETATTRCRSSSGELGRLVCVVTGGNPSPASISRCIIS